MKKLNRKQLLTRRRATLLTELETAAGQVLADLFAFEETAVSSFLEQTRAAYQQMPPGKGSLPEIAQRFGLAGGAILISQYRFTTQMVDVWLGKLVERGQENRRQYANANGA